MFCCPFLKKIDFLFCNRSLAANLVSTRCSVEKYKDFFTENAQNMLRFFALKFSSIGNALCSGTYMLYTNVSKSAELNNMN